ncbi:hypothetical protein AB3U43_04090 (plasmid) [Bacillus cereus]|uniref:hypothetical protein n=1 Tax=Bacillus cereus TaxID=1396 RepID=UPI0034CD2B8B
MFKKQKKILDPLEVLINGKGDLRSGIPTEIGIYALERIKMNQSNIRGRIDISHLGKRFQIDTKEVEIKKSEEDEWFIKFGEYDFNICKNGFRSTPIYFKWINEKTFKLQIQSHISDSSNIYVTFYGDLAQLTKQQYFAEKSEV